ncbi:hypothetical protein V493_03936 [Pseudogymnoascus sp. VKM F-4281 (FW-2241)]|nr:hypothetical protein V493_03936 [Pseudogymnoascus sp. VKM F-4281 (FW-2241)]
MKLANLLAPLAAIAPAIVAGQCSNRGFVESLRSDPSVPYNPAYDDSRIKDFPDKRLLCYSAQYFLTFILGDFEGMHDLQTEEFHITDIPLSIVRADREQWLQVNSGFSSLMTDVKVQAISIDGSSEPGKFSVMENVVWFTLAVDPPESAKPGLPPGIKKGDTSAMIMMSVIWWNAEGKVTRELEYGKLIWPDFDIDNFEKW